jgi:hypothetical protein
MIDPELPSQLPILSTLREVLSKEIPVEQAVSTLVEGYSFR